MRYTVILPDVRNFPNFSHDWHWELKGGWANGNWVAHFDTKDPITNYTTHYYYLTETSTGQNVYVALGPYDAINGYALTVYSIGKFMPIEEEYNKWRIDDGN